MLNFFERTASAEAGAKPGGKVLARVPYYFAAALLWAALNAPAETLAALR